jgi:hypothetical protein
MASHDSARIPSESLPLTRTRFYLRSRCTVTVNWFEVTSLDAAVILIVPGRPVAKRPVALIVAVFVSEEVHATCAVISAVELSL